MKKLCFLLAFLLVFIFAGAASANLITNGTFDADLLGWNATDVTWWTYEGHTSARFNDGSDNNSRAQLIQSFYIPDIEKVSGLSIEFDLNFRTSPDVDLARFSEVVGLQTSIGNPWQYQSSFNSYERTDGWTHFAVELLFGPFDIIDPNAKIVFSLFDDRAPDNSRAYLDNVDVSAMPVPEPATMLLLGVGLVGLASAGRKKFFKK